MNFSYKKLTKRLLSLNRFQKSLLISLADYFSLVFALWLSLSLSSKTLFYNPDLIYLLLLPFLAIAVFYIFDLYRSVIRFISFRAFWEIMKALTLFTLLLLIISSQIRSLSFFSVSIIINYWALSLLLICGVRMTASWVLLNQINPSSRVVIYGAGSAGLQLATALKFSKEMKPVAFIDSDKSSQGSFVNGLEVFSPSDLEELIIAKEVQEVLIAIPSASKSVLKDILKDTEKHPIKVRILPGVAELALGKVSVSELKEVQIEDLLGRETARPNQILLDQNIKNKVVMVTGAGGSIGSELCRQIIKHNPLCLVLLEISEYSIYSIERELHDLDKSIKFVPLLGSVSDKIKLKAICETFKVNTIYHAAAYKHVPLVEMNPIQGIENNIFGTLSCVQAAIESNVETFVLISTDKAVRPTNMMGATKRFSELILQALAKEELKKVASNRTLITMVRFGNVLDSAGSVVPLFREQIKNGGPITVTDPEIIRYFMSIPEAAELVIQAGAMTSGGEVFVLDMGEQMKIFDLAERMIRLSGMQVRDDQHPSGDIEIVISGLRHGEKLYEELLVGNNSSPTQHDMIFQAQEASLSWESVKVILKDLNDAISIGDQDLIRKIMIGASTDYEPTKDIHDLLYVHQKNKH